MKNLPDPLLTAILAADERVESGTLDAALMGARFRRRRRTVWRSAFGIAGSLILVFIASRWMMGPRSDSLLVLVDTTSVGVRQVSTSPAGLTIISTSPGGYEPVTDDNRLLDLLPGAIGFIGDRGERRLVWLLADSALGKSSTQ